MLYVRRPEAAAAGEALPVAALLGIAIASLVAAALALPLFQARDAAYAAGLGLVVSVFVVALCRPVAACAVLAIGVPLTAGLGRGTVVPLLRPGEVLILVTLAGLVARACLRPGRPRGGAGFGGLDWLVAGFVAVAVAVPAAVLMATGATADLAAWMSVLAPGQFLLVYWIYAHAELDSAGVRHVVNAILVAGTAVGLIGIAQAADLPGVRAFSDAYFPEPAAVAWQEPVYRAYSTLEHFSALGAFGVFIFVLAFALYTYRVPGFSALWLCAVMAVAAGGIVASQTWASAVALPAACAVVAWHARRLPPHTGPLLAVAAAGLVGLWPVISSRFAQQQVFATASGLIALPHTMEVRVQYWTQFFIPSLLTDHRFLLGTGTLIPSDVPAALDNFVDNEFIRMAFRAGMAGVVALVGVQAILFAVAWRARGDHHWAGTLGATAAGCLLALGLMETTAEYMGFAGVCQLLWMLIGLFALARVQPLELRPAAIAAPPRPRQVFDFTAAGSSSPAPSTVTR